MSWELSGNSTEISAGNGGAFGVEASLAAEHEAYPRDHETSDRCPLCRAGVPDTFPLWLRDVRSRSA